MMGKTGKEKCKRPFPQSHYKPLQVLEVQAIHGADASHKIKKYFSQRPDQVRRVEKKMREETLELTQNAIDHGGESNIRG